MQKVVIEEIKDLTAYERARGTLCQDIIALKKRRRIELGPLISLLFENHETVLWQIQEMVRVERIVDPKSIEEEVEVYNALIPSEGNLCATLFIQIDEKDAIKSQLDRLMGIDEGDQLYFLLGTDVHIRHDPGPRQQQPQSDRTPVLRSSLGSDERIVGRFEAGRSKEDKISAIHFVTFTFSDAQREMFRDPSISIRLVVQHPNYRHEMVVGPELHQALVEDLSPR